MRNHAEPLFVLCLYVCAWGVLVPASSQLSLGCKAMRYHEVFSQNVPTPLGLAYQSQSGNYYAHAHMGPLRARGQTFTPTLLCAAANPTISWNQATIWYMNEERLSFQECRFYCFDFLAAFRKTIPQSTAIPLINAQHYPCIWHAAVSLKMHKVIQYIQLKHIKTLQNASGSFVCAFLTISRFQRK